MKKIIYILCSLLILGTYTLKAQLYNTNTGFISFYSKTIAKNIYAESKTSMAVLKINSNDIAVRINNASFKFENSLMEEHFNEKYIETPKYPISTFSGKINEKIDYSKFGEINISVTGKFNIHGVEQTKVLVGKMIIAKDKVTINGSFKIKLEEYKIEKPTIVFKEIADELDIKVNLELIKK